MGGILAKPTPKKGKTITTETLHLVTNICENDNFSRYVPEKYSSKGVHKQKSPKCKYWFFKVRCLET